MNCITDLVCQYHSKYGLIENVNLISLNEDDCAINIFSNNSLVRTSVVNIKILIKPHEKLYEIEKVDTKQNLILSTDNYSCIVKAIKILDEQSVEVMPTSDLLLNGEQTKCVSVESLSICGEYENFDALKSISIPMPCEYSRYFNNVSIFKPLLSHTKNVLICWNADELELKIMAFDDARLKKIEFLMPIFISQLALLLCGKQTKTLEVLASYLVWEYQYENEEEANYAIGPKGSHILAVRNFKGIAGVILTKSNRLRIIAENKFALKEARALLEIRRDSFMFDDSLIPILIGKNANHISELVNKTGLHCILVPHVVWSPAITNDITVVSVSEGSSSPVGKRQLQLYGTRDSITSAKLLLELEESVKDLKKEFEQRKNCTKLPQSFSLKSSTSSVSRESDKQQLGAGQDDVVFEDALGGVICDDSHVEHDEHEEHVLAWADTQDDSVGDDDVIVDARDAGVTTVTKPIKEEYMDFFCSSSSSGGQQYHQQQQQQQQQQVTNARNRYQKKTWNDQQSPEPRSNQNYNQKSRPINQKRPPLSKSYSSGGGGGGMLFTNSTLSSCPSIDGPIQDESQSRGASCSGVGRGGGGQRPRNSGPVHQNNWNSHHHQQQQQHHHQQQQQQQQQQQSQHHSSNYSYNNNSNSSSSNNNSNNNNNNNNSYRTQPRRPYQQSQPQHHHHHSHNQQQPQHLQDDINYPIVGGHQST